MKKFKNGLLAVGCLATMIVGINSVSALTNENIGRELTETEYSNFINIGLDDDTIANLDVETFNKFKDFVVSEQVKEVKYFKEVKISPFTYSNSNDRYVNIEITEDEYNNSIEPYASTHETNYKKLEIAISKPTSSATRAVTSKLTWKKVPSTKSIDDYGFYVTSGQIDVPYATQTMTQAKFDENCGLGFDQSFTSSYNSNNVNWKTQSMPSGLGYKGTGISMSLTLPTFCINDIGVSIVSTVRGYQFTMITAGTPGSSGKLSVNASYQHAQSGVSMTEAKNYTFSASGYGGVFKFNSSVASKYDNMGGVSASL